MKYQLVLQWVASTLEDYDRGIMLEDALTDRLSDSHEVDGHDMGSGTFNIFTHTDDPKRAFSEIKEIFDLANARVAYRDIDGDDYTILWPIGLTDFKLM